MGSEMCIRDRAYTVYFSKTSQRFRHPKQAASGFSVPRTSCYAAPSPVLASAGLSSKLGLSEVPPSPSQVSTLCRSLCSPYHVAPGRAQTVTDLRFHKRTLPARDPRINTPSGQLLTTLEHHITIFTNNTPKGQTPEVPEPAGANTDLWGQAPQSNLYVPEG